MVPPSSVRKPLLQTELNAPTSTIMVTGATGYIGSRVVERLLDGGHSVHALARPRPANDPEDMLLYLKRLPGAAERLHVITGDVTSSQSLLEAMQGCQQLVHLAAVVDLLTPKHEEQRQAMLKTAMQGTQLVLDAATAAGSVSKVVLVSSIVAIMWDWWERGAQHMYTEEDWTLDCSLQLNTYAFCKRESERLAYQLAEGKSWQLVTVNPGIVFGPVATRRLAQSVSVRAPIVQHMNGDKYPFTSNMFISHVDLDDVAAAICGLLFAPGATGRHLLMSGPPPSMPQIARLLHDAYPAAKVPPFVAPAWAVALLAEHRSQAMGFDLPKFRAMHNKPFHVDASKVTRVLPDFSYISLEDSVRAAADSIVAMGLAAFRQPTLSCCGALPRDDVLAHASGTAACSSSASSAAASTAAGSGDSTSRRGTHGKMAGRAALETVAEITQPLPSGTVTQQQLVASSTKQQQQQHAAAHPALSAATIAVLTHH